MLIGETVEVIYKEISSTDPFGAEIRNEVTETVTNVLVEPSTTVDIKGNLRPDGVEAKYTLHFPKTFNKNLTGCEIVVRGERLKVVGAPAHYTLENTPTDWWLPVNVSVVNG